MAVSTFARKKAVDVFGLNSGIRRCISSVAGVPQFCYMMGKYGEIIFPGDRWQGFPEFFKENPLLTPLPSGRLFDPVDPSRPYRLSDKIRELFQSGVAVPYICRKKGVSLLNPFQMGNVGVIKDLGLIAFKKLELDPSNGWVLNCDIGYKQFCALIKDMVVEEYGSPTLNMLPLEVYGYFDDLNAVTQPEWEEYVFDHPTHLSDLNFGHMVFEVYRLLMQEGPALQTARYTTHSILTDIGTAQPGAFIDCANNKIIKQFYPKFLKKRLGKLTPLQAAQTPAQQSLTLGLQTSEIGTIIVEVCRERTPVSTDEMQ